MSEKAPMPPWWVERTVWANGEVIYHICAGRPDSHVRICALWESQYSNAKELADLIVQRTKQ